MKILITGGGGFVGNYLVDYLSKKRSNIITVFDNYMHGFPVKFPTKKNILSPVHGNIRNYYDISRCVERFQPDVVIHLAAHNTRPESVGNFKKCAEINYVGTANLLDACVSSKFRTSKVILASSESVNNSLSHYGISKKAAGDLLLAIAPRAGIQTWVLEFVEIYGYSKPFTSLSQVNFLVENILRNNNIAIYGATAEREYIHLSDVVRSIELSVESEENFTSSVSIGTGSPIITKDLIEKIKKIVNYTGSIKYLDHPAVPVISNKTDTAQAKSVLGFECVKNFDEGLKELIRKRKRDLK